MNSDELGFSNAFVYDSPLTIVNCPLNTRSIKN